MLLELSIRNFAIIDDLNIQFSEGLTILSGETGAGKSIILNAVNLLLGSRAAASLIRTGSDTAELEALFKISPNSRAARVMIENDYPIEDGLLVRRVISRSNQNRIYINGRLSTIQLLNSITDNLASISGQHAHQGLLKDEQHLLILDQFAGLMPQRETMVTTYHDLLPLIEQLERLKDIQKKQAEQIDYLTYQRREIMDADISPGEDIALEQEKVKLKNGELLYQTAHDTVHELYNAEGSIIEKLTELKKGIEKASRLDPYFNDKLTLLSDVGYQVEDLVTDLRSYLTNVRMDEKRLEAVDERLDTLNRLKRKYGGSIEEVLSHLEVITNEMDGIESIAEKISEIEKQISHTRERLVQVATELSGHRVEAAKIIADKIESELGTLSMKHTRFQVNLKKMSPDDNVDSHLVHDQYAIHETGFERAVFSIAPNVGETLKPLASIASGGELSRVVLAVKAILAETESVETIVFDEVDAGIGGGVAEVVGKKLADLAAHHQVICITHLPQIAKFGNFHFGITKDVSDGRTRTLIKPLTREQRIEEIARMLGGVNITETTLEHARELFDHEVMK